ncbi:ribonuclease Z [uncultured Hymenobacter sp.]|uniref:ribonuclease Z n=1 Tax=uncultured Hymenobacter sp. TaxID=170016 RepID=UPI0035C9F001
MDFELTILGSASATPVLGRHPTAQVLTAGPAQYLLDCGEGTQWRLLENRVRHQRLRAIFISHLHGDHVFGLFGLLGTMHLAGRTEPLQLIGPPGLDELLTAQFRCSTTRLDFDLNYTRVDTAAHAVVYEDAQLRAWSLPLEHRIPCAGYLFEEQPRRANLLKERLPAGLTPSQLAQLAQGNDLLAEEGGVGVRHADVAGPVPTPRRYAFCSDTRHVPGLAALVRGADLLYHEATFLDESRERAAQTFHSTARQAAELAQAAGVARLLIGHFSSRYKALEPLLLEARAVFEPTDLAAEGLSISL